MLILKYKKIKEIKIDFRTSLIPVLYVDPVLELDPGFPIETGYETNRTNSRSKPDSEQKTVILKPVWVRIQYGSGPESSRWQLHLG